MSSVLDDQVKPVTNQALDETTTAAVAAAVTGADDDDLTDSSIFDTDGLRVLAVDDSVVCLKILVALLRQCKYNVTETTNPVEALQILRTRKHEFDIVITDLRMLEMDGLVLLQKISLEMDLPVVMLSADDKQENIMKAIRYGARDYLIKPPRMAQMKNVWQHVVRKRLFGTRSINNNNNNNTSSITKEEEEETLSPPKIDKSKRKVEIGEDEKGKEFEEGDNSEGTKKKRRVNWTVDLHNKFTDAIEKIGPNAVPMEILKVMNVPWLTRANVASHLQKFKNAIRGQAQSEPHVRNVFSSNVNDGPSRNGYQSSVNSSAHGSYATGMMKQAIGTTNPYLPQQFPYQQNNQNSRIFPQGNNKHLLSHSQNCNPLMNPSGYPAATMLNNAPLPARKVAVNNHLQVPRFDGLMFSAMGNNLTNSLNQPFPSFHTPALFPAPIINPSPFAGNMTSATSGGITTDSNRNDTLANEQNYAALAPDSEKMYPQLDWTSASDFPDIPMSNPNSKTSDFNVGLLQNTQMETWSMNNNLIINSAPFETSNLSNSHNMIVEAPNFHRTTHEELPMDASFQPINTNMSDEDDNDELNTIVNSFNFEAPPCL